MTTQVLIFCADASHGKKPHKVRTFQRGESGEWSEAATYSRLAVVPGREPVRGATIRKPAFVRLADDQPQVAGAPLPEAGAEYRLKYESPVDVASHSRSATRSSCPSSIDSPTRTCRA